MDLETLIVAVFCLVDDLVRDLCRECRLRQRGPAPVLADSEVLTVEIVGEFLGLDTDPGPARPLPAPLRPPVPRPAAGPPNHVPAPSGQPVGGQAGALAAVRGDDGARPGVTIVDSMPVSVCRFARAHRCRSLRDLSAFGHGPVAHQTYYGLRLHLRVAWPGVITAAVLAPANEADRSVAPQLLAGLAGWALGDKGYRSPALRAELATGGINQELSNKDCRSREWFINSERYMWAARIQEQERIPMRQRAIAFTLATGMALAGVTLPDVAHADRDDGNRNRV